ncbi:4Fe-4S ferredoxin [Pyrobaculum sp. 3827-6]|uniref:4Fe-4S ferredoxin n=1 Tax=Pyrobaculum sp. 3827-6 TaxID=2983604 RepID=UPI0021DB1145|nr:4Fe-4S ferredoxin [Pyrobaculum sp. 3827-6]MCU7788062.1 4Fe-4S ferredoxin [Pyrobaculum sp. 3827-6]
MVEFVIEDEAYTDDERLAVAVGLSATFRQVLVKAAPSREALEAARGAAWGALLITPCPPGLECFTNLEKAVDHSEMYSTPVGYEGPAPAAAKRRVSTFNKHYMKPWRWASGGEKNGVGHELLPLMACLYRLLKMMDAVPIVVSDVRLTPAASAQPDYMVVPTWHEPAEVAEVVDIHLPPLKASAIALGILIGRYNAGPVVAVAKREDHLVAKVAELGGYAVVLDHPGDACDLFKKRVVGYTVERRPYRVEPALCDRCGDCLKTACPAIAPSRAGTPQILDTCTGCGACAILCTRGAIR